MRAVARIQLVTCLLAAVGFTAASSSKAHGRDLLRRDVEGYAIASCLVAQDQPALKDQGDGWASAIVQRSRGGLDQFTAVTAAVRAELVKGNMATIRSETEPGNEKRLPIMYCAELIDTPSVRAAIDKAVKGLARFYR